MPSSSAAPNPAPFHPLHPPALFFIKYQGHTSDHWPALEHSMWECEKPPSVNHLPCVASAARVLAVSNAFVVARFRTWSDTLLRASACSYLASLHIRVGLENECVLFSLQLCEPQQLCCILGQLTNPQNHQQSHIIFGCDLVLGGLDCVKMYHSGPRLTRWRWKRASGCFRTCQ